MVGKVDEQLALLALPCELLTRNLSITFDQLSKWSEAMLEQDGLHYARHVIPTLVLFLRSTYPVDFTQWLLELARDRWDFTFTVGEEQERVWQIIEVEVDGQTGIASACFPIPPQTQPKLTS